MARTKQRMTKQAVQDGKLRAIKIIRKKIRGDEALIQRLQRDIENTKQRKAGYEKDLIRVQEEYDILIAPRKRKKPSNTSVTPIPVSEPNSCPIAVKEAFLLGADNAFKEFNEHVNEYVKTFKDLNDDHPKVKK